MTPRRARARGVPCGPRGGRSARRRRGGGVPDTGAGARRSRFPEGPTVERRHGVFLTDEQLRRRGSSRAPDVAVAGPRHPLHREGRIGAPLGTAYFDTHRVRSVDETLMVVVDPSGRASRVEILAFDEPPEYLPKKGWLAQLLGASSTTSCGCGAASVRSPGRRSRRRRRPTPSAGSSPSTA